MILARSAFLTKGLQMSTHNICFYGELEKIIPELSSNMPPYQVLWRSQFMKLTFRLCNRIKTDNAIQFSGSQFSSFQLPDGWICPNQHRIQCSTEPCTDDCRVTENNKTIGWSTLSDGFYPSLFLDVSTFKTAGEDSMISCISPVQFPEK